MTEARYPMRVVGDVHGEFEPFAGAISGAATEGRFVIQLGDLVDRGPDSPACLDAAIELVRCGRGLFLRGNHDDKLVRSLLGRPVKIGAELVQTRHQIEQRTDRQTLINRFLDTWAAAPWWLLVGRILFVHGAFHPAMLDHKGPDTIPERRLREKVKWLALYAEGRMSEGGGIPKRTYGWVDTIPAGVSVIVGHDVRSTQAPVVVTNPAGGRAVFMDTGCGKGGHLSWLDVHQDRGLPVGRVLE